MKDYRIGIDVGGTKVAYGLFDGNNNLVKRMQHPTPVEADGAELADVLISNILDIIANQRLTQQDVQGIGICMPSFIIFEKGYIYMTSALKNVNNFPLRDYFMERLSIPVILDNDANVAALAEHAYGAGRGSKNMIYMAVSTGIGSGLILNGGLFRGSYGWAGESGHMLITPDAGVECGCRNKGCFMSWSSGMFIPQHLRRMTESKPVDTVMDLTGKANGLMLLEACRAGDALALKLLDQMAHNIAVCCFNIYQLLNVNLYVFGGGLTNFGDLLFSRVRAEFDRYNHVPLPVEFRFAELKQDFGIIGAAELVREL